MLEQKKKLKHSFFNRIVMHKETKSEDKLYQFIQQNRDEFDEDLPTNDWWNQIEKQIQPKKPAIHRKLTPIFKYVAAAVFLMVFGAAVWTLMNDRNVKQDPLLSVANTYSPQYAKQISNFESLIAERSKELKKEGQTAPTYYKTFTNDLNDLEATYQTLKNDLYSNPNKEELLIALIQNLQLQAEVLSKQINVLKNINTNSHENQ